MKAGNNPLKVTDSGAQTLLASPLKRGDGVGAFASAGSSVQAGLALYDQSLKASMQAIIASGDTVSAELLAESAGVSAALKTVGQAVTGAHISQRYDREGNFLKDGHTYATYTDEIANNTDFHNTLVQKFMTLAIGDGGADGAVVAAWQARTVLAQGTRGRDVVFKSANDNFARSAA